MTSSQVPCHAKATGSLAMCASGKLLGSCSADGEAFFLNMPALILAGTIGTERSVSVSGLGGGCLHATALGGATTGTFDATGRFFATAGPDGSLFVHPAPGAVCLQPVVRHRRRSSRDRTARRNQ